MNTLPLDSLLIENFRLIRHMEIPKLARVNLLVGKNNVGKSSILEALELYARRNHQTIWKFLAEREEGQNSPQSGERDEVFPRNLQFSPVLTLTHSGQRTTDEFDINRPALESIPSLHAISVSADSLDNKIIKQLWGRIALTTRKQIVIEALQQIIPKVEDLGIITNPELGEDELTAVKLRDTETPILLKSLGEGANRLFAIVLALVNSANGLLLVDEIESGLHYSVQQTLWQTIFQQAEKLNVQVFATTHSNDCIATFQTVANEHPADGMLIRLERRQDDIVAVTLDENELTIATEQQIEVR